MTAKTKAKIVDIADLNTTTASDKGAEVELLHPITQAPLGLFVTVLGKHSQIFRDHIREKVNTRIRAESMASKRGKQAPLSTAEEVERDAIELIVLCTTGWRSQSRDAKGNFVEGTASPNWTLGGEELPFTVQNAIRVYTDILWIREQVDNAIGDLENFITA